MNNFDFIMVKDPHLMFGFRNRIRKPGWEKIIDSKLDQILSYMTTNKIQVLIFTGDVFEKNRRKDWSLNQYQQNKKRFKKFKKAKIQIYSNAGNHDYFDGYENIVGTAFGELVDLELLNYVGTYSGDIFLHPKVRLAGIDYHVDPAKIKDRMLLLNERKTEDQLVDIVLLHSNITPNNTKLTDFTYNQLANQLLSNIDIVCCGHWHHKPEKAIERIENTWFLNPWNLTRVTRDYEVKLDEHKPEFIHVSINWIPEPMFEFKEIFLECPVFSEAFEVETINLLQQLGTNFTFFELNEEDADDDFKLLVNIAKEKKLSEESLRIAKELLS